MSFASILGPPNNEPSPKFSETKLPRPATPPPKAVVESKLLPEKHDAPRLPEIDSSCHLVNGEAKSQRKAEVVHHRIKHSVPAKPRKVLTDMEADKILKALAIIDDATFSDVEEVGFYEHKERFKQRSRKRAADVCQSELRKRKVG